MEHTKFIAPLSENSAKFHVKSSKIAQKVKNPLFGSSHSHRIYRYQVSTVSKQQTLTISDSKRYTLLLPLIQQEPCQNAPDRFSSTRTDTVSTLGQSRQLQTVNNCVQPCTRPLRADSQSGTRSIISEGRPQESAYPR